MKEKDKILIVKKIVMKILNKMMMMMEIKISVNVVINKGDIDHLEEKEINNNNNNQDNLLNQQIQLFKIFKDNIKWSWSKQKKIKKLICLINLIYIHKVIKNLILIKQYLNQNQNNHL